MMRSSILGASTMLNVLIQHLPLQSLFWTKIWRAFRASDPSSIYTNVHNPYVCDPLGPYISLVTDSIDLIILYQLIFINYLLQIMDKLINN